ncbi:Uncharacterised protein [BD1-7 clade bacterium]|uniref:Uncharacterized protein n=1 Tax=BD1-7 clade bacterium TaxID=2029982 RepID=A0A5S9PIU1_9GAMM|nr:Uncharacterised protein [BD1-7 clade bacterium]
MKIDKPQYYIKASMADCPRVIMVNGVEIERDDDGYTMDAEFPINQYIRDGMNHFSLNMADDNYLEKRVNEFSKCSVSILVKGTVEEKQVEFVVGDIQYNPNVNVSSESRLIHEFVNGNYVLSNDGYKHSENGQDGYLGEILVLPDPFDEEGVTYSRQFKANLPFDEWEFLKGDVFFQYPMNEENYEELEEQIWPLVIDLWDLFEKKDIAVIREIFAPRSLEYDTAFYKEPGTTLREMMTALDGFYEEEYPLNRKHRDYMQMNVSYSGRLVTIVNAASGSGTIMFYDKDTDMNWFFEATWMRKDGQWILTR